MTISSPSKEYEVILLWRYGLLKELALGKKHNYYYFLAFLVLGAYEFFYYA